MTTYGDYTTVHFARSMYLSSDKSGDDNLILSFIRQSSREIDRLSGKKFFPTVESRKFDVPKDGGSDIYLDADLLTLLSITNGDGSSISLSDVILIGNNDVTKNIVRLPQINGLWLPDGSTEEQAITITGVWSNLYDPTAGWLSTDTLDADMLDSDIAFESVVDRFKSGDLIKIDSEFMYVLSVASPGDGETKDTVTVERATNGTTAASHESSSTIYMWNPGYEIQMLTAISAISYYQLRSNPLTSSYTADGVTIYTPKDITKFIKNKLADLRLLRIGLA